MKEKMTSGTATAYSFRTFGEGRLLALIFAWVAVLACFFLSLLQVTGKDGLPLAIAVALGMMFLAIVLSYKFLRRTEVLSFDATGISSNIYGNIPYANIRSYEVNRFRGAMGLNIVTNSKTLRINFNDSLFGDSRLFERAVADFEGRIYQYNEKHTMSSSSNDISSLNVIKKRDFFASPYAKPLMWLVKVITVVGAMSSSVPMVSTAH